MVLTDFHFSKIENLVQFVFNLLLFYCWVVFFFSVLHIWIHGFLKQLKILRNFPQNAPLGDPLCQQDLGIFITRPLYIILLFDCMNACFHFSCHLVFNPHTFLPYCYFFSCRTFQHLVLLQPWTSYYFPLLSLVVGGVGSFPPVRVMFNMFQFIQSTSLYTSLEVWELSSGRHNLVFLKQGLQKNLR